MSNLTDPFDKSYNFFFLFIQVNSIRNVEGLITEYLTSLKFRSILNT